jgi:hypothetical protein
MRGIWISANHVNLLIERDNEVIWMSLEISYGCEMDWHVIKDPVSCDVSVSSVCVYGLMVVSKHVLLETVSAICCPVYDICVVKVRSVPDSKIGIWRQDHIVLNLLAKFIVLGVQMSFICNCEHQIFMVCQRGMSEYRAQCVTYHANYTKNYIL